MAEKDLDKRSVDAEAAAPYLDLAGDVIAGVEAMQRQGEKYLPKHPREDAETYKFRLSLAKMTNVFRDVVDGLASKPFEQEVTLTKEENTEIPLDVLDFAENVDGAGTNITMFAHDWFFKGIAYCVDYVMVDYPVNQTGARTRAEARELGLRPYWSHLLARNVLELRSSRIGNQQTLVYARIYEPGKPNHVRIFERSATGVITWRLMREVVDGSVKEWVEEATGELSIDVIPIIPFATGRRDGNRFYWAPPLRDALDLQRNLYRNETGLENAKEMTAYPMLAAIGVKPEKDTDGKIKPMTIGPHIAVFSTPDGNGNSGDFKWIEPAGTSLDFLSKENDKTVQNLRELGKQPLTAQSGLTVITTAYAAGKSRSAVQVWANGLKDALENALVVTCKFMNITMDQYDPTVNVFSEFDEFLDGANDENTLLEMRKNGDLSQETLHREMKRRGKLSSDFDHAQEVVRIANEIPGEPLEEENT